jgi:hypothetical protein
LQPSDGHAETFPFTIMEKKDLLNVIVLMTFPFTIMEKKDLLNVIVLITAVEIDDKLLHCSRMMRIKCPS